MRTRVPPEIEFQSSAKLVFTAFFATQSLGLHNFYYDWHQANRKQNHFSDMSNNMEKFTASRLIGSLPGYGEHRPISPATRISFY
jgi:hypothetical protein